MATSCLSTLLQLFLHIKNSGEHIYLFHSVSMIMVLLLPYTLPSLAEFKSSLEVDLEYTWKCTRSDDTCKDTNAVTPNGQVIYFVLLLVFLSKDLVCGLMMVI